MRQLWVALIGCVIALPGWTQTPSLADCLLQQLRATWVKIGPEHSLTKLLLGLCRWMRLDPDIAIEGCSSPLVVIIQ